MAEFEAKYWGVCASCNEPFTPGTAVRYAQQESGLDRLVHVACPGAAADPLALTNGSKGVLCVCHEMS